MKRYLGDAVYVDVVNGMLVLTTEYGMTYGLGLPYDNRIFLEAAVYEALVRYVNNLKEAPIDLGEPLTEEEVGFDVLPD